MIKSMSEYMEYITGGTKNQKSSRPSPPSPHSSASQSSATRQEKHAVLRNSKNDDGEEKLISITESTA